MLIQIKNLLVIYPGNVCALSNISFDIIPGEILGVVGESGSGKSTFAYSLLGLLPKNSQKQGYIGFSGSNILALPESDLVRLRGSQISLICQDPASTFNPVFTIKYQFQEILREKLHIKDKSQSDKIIFNCLEKVHLLEVSRMLKSYPHQLSGGQLQRIAIAMAIALNPKVLIADEPTSSLDVTVESEIMSLFKELRDHLGLTIVFITHNLDLVRTICDRAVVLYKGKICEIAKSDKLFSNPQHSYTKSLLAAFRELEK